jgi:SAM-dependent methyltransferase
MMSGSMSEASRDRAERPIRRPKLTPRHVLGLAARRARLVRPAYRLYERYRALRGARHDTTTVTGDGLPLPPALLRVRVTASPEPDEFLRSGKEGAELIRRTVANHVGSGIESLGALLDFGCGCGRVARYWARLDGPDVFGCDYNPELVAWCRENLPFMQADVNGLSPPLPHPAERFDLVYAISVFTHLSERMQHEWMAEMRRVLRPGGLLFFTTHGDRYAEALTKPGGPGLDDYRAGRLVVTDEEVEGLNLCAAFHPYRWVVDEMLTGFELLEHSPEGAWGGHDLYFARRL